LLDRANASEATVSGKPSNARFDHGYEPGDLGKLIIIGLNGVAQRAHAELGRLLLRQLRYFSGQSRPFAGLPIDEIEHDVQLRRVILEPYYISTLQRAHSSSQSAVRRHWVRTPIFSSCATGRVLPVNLNG
jgi:hypothetical protein